jgi:hypothetical protein
MPKQLTETAAISEAAAATAKETGLLPIQFISPGWGSSGYYSTEVLEQAAADKVIPAGTHMYADHPTDTEFLERPGRSIKDLMAVTVEDAKLNSDGALVGEVQVVPAWRNLLETVRDHIGVSIRGSATDIVEGEAEGRRGGIIEGLVAPVTSVDFVTRAGRGGKVLRVLESAAANRRAIGHGIAEATVNDTREALQTALRDAYAVAQNTWLYVRDFDDSTVWFEVEGSGAGDTAGVYGQPYTETDGVIALTGTRTEVRVQTKYVPVTRPDSTTPTTEADQEVTMGNIQIEESEHKALVEKAGRVDALEAERDTEKNRAENAENTLAERDRVDAARKIITERATAADMLFTPLEERGLLADLPLKENDLDTEAFTKTVDEAAATRKAGSGAGTVTGFGGTPGGGGESTLTEAQLDAKVGAAFGRQVKEA